MKNMFEENELGKTFMEKSPFVINIWSEDLDLLCTSQQSVDMFELENQQEYIDRFYELSPEFQPCGTPSGELAEYYVKKAFEEGRCTFEWQHKNLKGELIPAEITLVRYEHGGEYRVMAITVDLRKVDEARKREQEATELSRIAEEESRSKSRFLARMSHELRTPMNAILGIAGLELQKDTHTKEAEEAFLHIYNSSNLLLKIINDILDLSKVTSGRMEIAPEKYDFASFLIDTLQLNLVFIGNKEIKFSIDVDENIPVTLIGDELRVEQILNNVLSNAFKYTNEGFVSMAVRLDESSKGEDAVLVYTVKDTGQGMTQEQISNLFEIEYSRYNLKSNRTVEGTGLGMSIAGQLVNMMGGRIDVVSEVGKGSTFTIYLPQKRGSNGVLGKECVENLQNIETVQKFCKKVEKTQRKSLSNGRVLIVDDVEINLHVAKEMMRPYGLTVETVISGIDAIKKIRDGAKYDIIFMDHMMPEMDGIEATAQIRKMGCGLPIIALTANVFSGADEMFVSKGFTDFLPKPISIDKLNTILTSYVRNCP